MIWLRWLLTPFAWWLLYSLVPAGVDGIELAIEPATALIIASLIGAAGSVGGGMLAKPSTTGGGKEALKALSLSPLGGGSLEQGLRLQAMLQIGVDPNEMAKELWAKQIESTLDPVQARHFLQTVQTAQARLGYGDVAGAQALIDPYNKQLAGYGVRKRKKKSGLGKYIKNVGPIPVGSLMPTSTDTSGTPAPATFGGPLRIEDGEIIIDIPGGLGDQVEAAFDYSDLIYGNRMEGLGNLSSLAADFPVATEQNLTDMTDLVLKNLRGDIQRDVQDQTSRIMQEANVSRVNPAAILGRLAEQEQIQYRKADETALDRAIQLLGGRQTLAANSIAGIQQALEPTLMNDLTGLGNLSLNASQIGAAQQQAFMNLMSQSNQAGAQAQGAGVAGAAGSTSSTLQLFALLKALGGPENDSGTTTSGATTSYGPFALGYGVG